mmetsp:Transcript_37167/g.94984  ORF Transcript_37167/g.94984 Transcript_37167/m.94984 type:complete len:379 (+) Transcript_37167:185-1321(+)
MGTGCSWLDLKPTGPAPLAVDVPHLEEDALEIGHPAPRVKQRIREAGCLEPLPQVLPVCVVQAQEDGTLLVLLLAADNHLVAEARRRAQRGGHARGHALQGQRHNRGARPQDVAPCGVRVAQRRVQKHVSEARAPDVQVLGGNVGEDDARLVDAAGRGLCTDLGLAKVREAEEPEDRVGDALEDVAPRVEGVRVVLVQLVGAAKDELVCGKAHVLLAAARGGHVAEDVQVGLLVVVDKVAVGHQRQVLAVAVVEVLGRDDLVSDEVWQVVGACGGGKAHVAGLHRRRLEREDLIACALGVSVQVHQHLDAVVADALRNGGHAPGRDVEEVPRLALDLKPPLGLVARRQRVEEDLHGVCVVHAEDRAHKVAERMVAKVR